MKSNILWDLDETLVHSYVYPREDTKSFFLEEGGYYYARCRPNIHRLIKQTRDAVGASNVYVVTMAQYDYACEINEIFDLGFNTDRIISAGDIRNKRTNGLEKEHNVLIDDLDFTFNSVKCDLFNVAEEDYCRIEAYHGVRKREDSIFSVVSEFLDRRVHKGTPI